MNKTYILGVAVLATALTSCVNDDSDLNDLKSNIEVKDISFDYSALSETDGFASEYEDDYVENSEFTKTVNVAFSDNMVTLSGDITGLTPSIEGSFVTITPQKKMEFILTGSTSNGGIKFYGENKYKVTLNGVSITNPNGPAINSQNKKRMFLVVNDGTQNTLSDGTSYTAYEDEDMKGTIFSEGKIITSGKGTLSVTSNCKHSIASDDYIIVRPGINLQITNNAASGIKGKDGVTILGGVLNIETSADGAKGISSDSCVVVRGGRTTIITSGASLVEDADTTSAAGVKGSSYTQNGGTVKLKSLGEGGKGINVDGNVTISGGELDAVTLGAKLLSSPKALKTDGKAVISADTYLYSKHASACDATGGMDIKQDYKSLNQEKHLLEVKY